MATQDRDDGGRFGEKMREQELLKAFDLETTANDPYLTVAEVQRALADHWEIDVTAEAVRTRLERMREDDLVDKREFGPGVAYRALVGPELSDEVEQAVAAQPDFDELERGDTTSHEDLWNDLDG